MEARELMNLVMQDTKKQSQTVGKTSSAEEKFYEAWREDADHLKSERAKKLRENSNLGIRFQRRTFETFDKSRDLDAYTKCLEYADHYADTERNSLLIVGGYGSGKTHLAASIANKLMDNGIPVLFDTFSGHLNKLKTEFNGGKSIYLEQMQNVDMLILDDVGKEKHSEWSQSIMFDVINYRYEHLYPIVMTTNLSNTELSEHLGSAVWSRLCEICNGVRTVGSDYRKK